MTKPGTETPAPVVGTLTRRDLFVGAGMTAGALAALGGIAGSAVSPTALAAMRSRKYYATQLALELDGQFAGLVLAAEGGDPVITPGDARLNTTATVRYEPLEIVIGDMTAPVFKWIVNSSAGAGNSRSCAIIAYNEYKEVYRLNMTGARVTGITTDSFEPASPLGSSPLRLTVKVLPTQSAHQFGNKSSFPTTTNLKKNLMGRENFRLYIQGLEASAPNVVAVDKVGLTFLPDGRIVPLPLKFNLHFFHAGPMIQWMQDTLNGKSMARLGELQMLSPDLAKVIGSAHFEGLMVTRVSCPLESVSGSMQLIEVECMPSSMKFNLGELAT